MNEPKPYGQAWGMKCTGKPCETADLGICATASPAGDLPYSGDVEKPNAYDLSGGMSCQCPQRIIMASIWDQQCTDVIGPGAAAAARK